MKRQTRGIMRRGPSEEAGFVLVLPGGRVVGRFLRSVAGL